MSQGLLTPEGKLKAKLRPFQETITVLDDARHPTRVLQQMTREPNVVPMLDGTLFADATFNAEGQLILDGLFNDAPAKANAEVKKLLGELTKLNAEKRPVWLRMPEWSSKLSSTLFEPVKLNMHPWDDKDTNPVALLQKHLAENKGPDAELCQHTRALGVYFTYTQDNMGNWDRRCLFKVETILPGYVKSEAGKMSPHDARLLAALEEICKPIWRAVAQKHFADKSDLKMKFAFDQLFPRVTKSSLTELQNAAAGDPSLDGTLLDTVTFDRSGNYQIKVFVNTKEAADKVKALAAKVLKSPEK